MGTLLYHSIAAKYWGWIDLPRKRTDCNCCQSRDPVQISNFVQISLAARDSFQFPCFPHLLQGAHIKHWGQNISVEDPYTRLLLSSTVLRDFQRVVFAEPDELAELCDFGSVVSVKTLNDISKVRLHHWAYAVRGFLGVGSYRGWTSWRHLSGKDEVLVLGAPLTWASMQALLCQIRWWPFKVAWW